MQPAVQQVACCLFTAHCVTEVRPFTTVCALQFALQSMAAPQLADERGILAPAPAPYPAVFAPAPGPMHMQPALSPSASTHLAYPLAAEVPCSFDDVTSGLFAGTTEVNQTLQSRVDGNFVRVLFYPNGGDPTATAMVSGASDVVTALQQYCNMYCVSPNSGSQTLDFTDPSASGYNTPVEVSLWGNAHSQTAGCVNNNTRYKLPS